MWRFRLHMTDDIRNLIPRDKFDVERAQAAIEAGYPAVASILYDLLGWIQDMSWPVADVIAPLLASIGEPLAPHIERAFATGDEIWKNWIVFFVIGKSPELAHIFRAQLEQFAHAPTSSESVECVDEYARGVLLQFVWNK